MEQQIEKWLERLDEILQYHSFESADEAERWIREQAQGRTVEEFLAECATPKAKLRSLLQQAEIADDPQIAQRLFADAIEMAEHEIGEEIAAAKLDPDLWVEEPASFYLHAMMGMGASCEMASEFAQAKDYYQQVLELDSSDPWQARTKLFSLAVMEGYLSEAEQLLSQVPDDESTQVRYHRALLQFLLAADEAEQRYQQSGDVEEASAWQDATANQLLELALAQNSYVAKLMGHPRAFELTCPLEVEQGSPEEAIVIMFATAHLWLSDFLALSWMLAELKNHPSEEVTHHAAWQKVLDQIGGEPTDEERFAFLRSLEEMDL
jgi:tetratricopeptide (TPR) repeat protein